MLHNQLYSEKLRYIMCYVAYVLYMLAYIKC